MERLGISHNIIRILHLEGIPWVTPNFGGASIPQSSTSDLARDPEMKMKLPIVRAAHLPDSTGRIVIDGVELP